MRRMSTNNIWNISVYNVSFAISLRCYTPAKCAQRHLKRRKGRSQAWKCHLELPKTRVESVVLFCFAEISFYVACFGWFLKGDFLPYVEPVVVRKFSNFTLLLSIFFGSPFEVVTYKSSCQYLCRKNGKTCFGIMSDIHRFWYLKWVDMENSARLPGRRDLSSGNLFWRWRSTFYWEFWHVSWTRVCWYKVAQWMI